MANLYDLTSDPISKTKIIIIDNGNQIQTGKWKEFFPEAIILTDTSLIFPQVSLLSEVNTGFLVINSNSRTILSREEFLAYVNEGARVSNLRSFSGFYIDNFYEKYPLTTKIFDVSTSSQVFLQTSSVFNLTSERSYWISLTALKISQAEGKTSSLQAQFYPALVVNDVPYPVENGKNVLLLLLIGFLIFIGLVY